MKLKYLILLTLAAVLLTACGPSEAEQQAAVQTQVALLQAQNATPETPAEAAPAEGDQATAGEPTSPDQPLELMPPLPSDASCTPDNTPRVLGTVTDIWSGDSFQVSVDGQSYEVRLIGIDKGDQPDTVLRQLVEGKQVMLITDTTDVDEYGRLPRYAIADGVFVNFRLLQQGAAYLALEAPDLACEDTFKQYK